MGEAWRGVDCGGFFWFFANDDEQNRTERFELSWKDAIYQIVKMS
jgi:hypothetical protein